MKAIVPYLLPCLAIFLLGLSLGRVWERRSRPPVHLRAEPQLRDDSLEYRTQQFVF